jgi:hypothetical protein
LSSWLPHLIRLTTRKGMPWLHSLTRIAAMPFVFGDWVDSPSRLVGSDRIERGNSER